MGRYRHNACHRPVTDINAIPADCPLPDDEPSVPADQIQSLIKTIREKLAKERGISPDRVLDKSIIILEQLIKNP